MTRPEGTKGAAVITREDVERAQAVLDAWFDVYPDVDVPPMDDWNKAKAHLRGLITTALADAHARGHDHGVARGRRIVANTVRDALDGEGL